MTMNIIRRIPRSEQFTTAGGMVVPERIVPGGIDVNGLALLAVIVAAYAVLLGGMD